LVTFGIGLDLLSGLAIGIAVSLMIVLLRTIRPYTTLLGEIRGSELYRDVRHCVDAMQIPGVRIFRFHASLYFGNADYFEVANGLTLS
jgi:MFS superfamily sulfate permease-like transporter